MRAGIKKNQRITEMRGWLTSCLYLRLAWLYAQNYHGPTFMATFSQLSIKV